MARQSKELRGLANSPQTGMKSEVREAAKASDKPAAGGRILPRGLPAS